MDHRSKLLSLSRAVGILLLPGSTRALWGFGRGSSNSDLELAKERVIADLRARIASDGFTPPVLGVGRKDAEKYVAARAAGELRCGGSVVKWEMVNDEFCDCEDGSDEPGTSACVNGVFSCANRGYIPLSLPSSRVGDGICDCCDGSDEAEGNCEITCGEASVAWMESLADRVVKIEQGNVKRAEYVKQVVEATSRRNQDLSKAIKAVDETKQELADAEEELETLEAEESEQRDIKLAETEGLVRLRVGNLSQDRITALAVAVASAEDPSAVLESVAVQVIKGVYVADVLKELSPNRREDSKKKPALKVIDEDETEHEPPHRQDLDDHVDLDDLDFMEDYGAMDMDDYYGGYGDWDGFLDDDYQLTGRGDEADNPVDVVHDKEAAGDIEASQVPVPGSNSEGSSSWDPSGGPEDTSSGPRESRPRTGREAEGKSEDETKKEKVHEEPFVTPREFKSLEYETPEAVEGRKTVKDLRSMVKEGEKALKALEDEASAYYGADNALWALKDRCLTHKAGGYDYRVCLFKDAHQEEPKSKTLIGKWKGIESSTEIRNQEGSDHLLNGEVLVFDRGQRCWNGPARSLRVALACGQEDVLTTVAEPETCAYTAVLETPAACSPGLVDLLLGKGSGAEPLSEAEGSADDRDRRDCRNSEKGTHDASVDECVLEEEF